MWIAHARIESVEGDIVVALATPEPIAPHAGTPEHEALLYPGIHGDVEDRLPKHVEIRIDFGAGADRFKVGDVITVNGHEGASPVLA